MQALVIIISKLQNEDKMTDQNKKFAATFYNGERKKMAKTPPKI